LLVMFCLCLCFGSANCGSVWAQTFSYDQFGNLSKSGSLTWACPTCYNGNNNQYNNVLSSSISYDADGNLLNDTFHKYTWDSYGHPVTIGGTSGTVTCGTSGTCLTYDALGRMVEKNVSGTFTQILYSPVGKTATMSGQSTTNAYFPLPAGETLFETGSTGGNRFFWHKDWLGTVRFESNMGTRASANDRAFAPFGEMYNNFGTTGNLSFTGDTQDTISGMFDTPNRELHPNQGRWISPDPAGLAAVDPSSPQTWNRYGYVNNNPLASIDPLGLKVGLCGSPENRRCQSDPVSGDGGGCTMDGVDTPCGLVSSALNSGAALQCPLNNCSVFGAYTGSNGKQYQFIPGVNGPVWIAPNGDELDNPPTEVGLGFAANFFDYSLGSTTDGAANNFGQGPTKPPSDPSHPPKPGTMTCPGELLAGAMRALGCFYEFACPSGQVYQGMQKCSITDPYGYKLCPATSTIQISPGQEVKVGPPPPGFCGPVKPN